MDDGYVVNGETWERVRDSQKDYSINPGTTAQIKLSSNWGNVKATDTISYGEVANGIKDIWIMNGSIYKTKPADWVD